MIHSIQFRTLSIPSCLLLPVICAIGCSSDDPIVRHEIPKERSGLEHLRDASLSAEEASAEKPAESSEQDRMVVALAMRDDATWFFKLNGPVSRVSETEDQWRPFLKSVSFDDSGKPEWELPDGWKVAGQKPMRFATLVVGPKKPPIELAISSLSAGQDLLLNVNRWRGQLGLDPTTEDDLKDGLTTIDAGDQKLTLFDATGKMSGGMMGASAPFAPFAQGGGRSAQSGGRSTQSGGRPNQGGGPSNAAKLAATSSKIEFTAPEGWQPGKPSPFLKARFSRMDGDQSAQISVSSLPAAANKWLPNVKRWVGQVGLDSLDETELAELTEAITVDGEEGKLVRLVPEEEGLEKATIAVMVKKDSNAWFFKLTGDRDMVKDSDQVLVDFLKTVTLP